MFLLRVALAFMALTQISFAQTPSREHAWSLYQEGKIPDALAEVEQVLRNAPDDVNALLNSALYNFDMGNLDAARGRAERLTRLTGSNATAWEEMIWITQAQGDLKRRDDAIDRWKIAVRSAIDPEIRRKTVLIRDRIIIPGHIIVVADYFARAGADFTRYQFTNLDPATQPDVGLVLRTDSDTTANWTASALLPPDKRLFHLDMVDVQPDGDEKVSIYQFYIDEPDYETVRAKVMDILRGEAKPLSGEPGSLAGLMKP